MTPDEPATPARPPECGSDRTGPIDAAEPMSPETAQDLRAVLAGLPSARAANQPRDYRTALLQAVLDNAPVRIYWKDATGHYLGGNRAFAADAGFDSTDALQGLTDHDMPWAAFADQFRQEDLSVFTTGEPLLGLEQPWRDVEGRRRWTRIFKVPLVDSEGHRLGVLGVYEDFTDKREAEAALEASRATLRSVIDHVPVGIFWKDRQGRFLGCNRLVAEHAGHATPEQLIGRDDYAMAWSQDALRYREDDRRVMQSGVPVLGIEEPQTSTDGEQRWLRTSKVPLRDDSGQVVGVLGVYEEITEHRRIQEALRLAASVMRHTDQAIFVATPDALVCEINDAFTRITGRSREQSIGGCLLAEQGGLQAPGLTRAIWQELLVHGHWRGELWNLRRNGERYAELLTLNAVCDEAGVVTHYVGIFSDISAMKETERELQRLAHFDALTGLPNRTQFTRKLQRAMEAVDTSGGAIAVVYIDLDEFKGVNDRLGHQAGDEVLRTLATAMQGALMPGDTLARIGGDEFVALLRNLRDEEDGRARVASLAEAADAATCEQPEPLGCTASLGVSFYPQDESIAPDQLLRQADQALYRAKLNGKHRYEIFDARMEREQRLRNDLVARIGMGLELGEFELHYQPQVHMRTGELLRVEALLRWAHPQRGLLLPADFLPAIEGTELELRLARWVLHQALNQLETWRWAGLDLRVSVNVGAHTLRQADLVEQIASALAGHPGLKAGALELEVVEGSALADVAQAAEVVAACHRMGVGFAVDDFGTGYASLTWLRRLGVATLKIDHSFVRDMLEDPDDLALIEGIGNLAASFRRRVVAEGVETIEQGRALIALGLEHGQGHAIAAPMPGTELRSWLLRWRPPNAWSDMTASNEASRAMELAVIEHRAWMRAVSQHLDGTGSIPELDEQSGRLGRWLECECLQRADLSERARELAELNRKIHAEVSALQNLPPAAARHPARRARLEADSLTLAEAVRRLGEEVR
jgi:diguanylate cyclase (GGDEF)-like protein/PAS domain S-box-containing protein